MFIHLLIPPRRTTSFSWGHECRKSLRSKNWKEKKVFLEAQNITALENFLPHMWKGHKVTRKCHLFPVEMNESNCYDDIFCRDPVVDLKLSSEAAQAYQCGMSLSIIQPHFQQNSCDKLKTQFISTPTLFARIGIKEWWLTSNAFPTERPKFHKRKYSRTSLNDYLDITTPSLQVIFSPDIYVVICLNLTTGNFLMTHALIHSTLCLSTDFRWRKLAIERYWFFLPTCITRYSFN